MKAFTNHFKKTNLIISISLILITAFHTGVLGQSRTRRPETESPDFNMRTFNGETVMSDSLKGKVILLEFWDTHCSPCILLMPDFEKLTQKYKDKKDVVIINVNAGWETEQSARTFIQKRAFKLNYAYMEKANSKRMKVNELPCTIIIDRDFNIRYKHIGLNEEKETNIISEFEKEIENLRVDK